jgi:hypothetical protein
MNPKPMKHQHIYVFAMVFYTLLFIAIAFGTESNPLNSSSALVPEARFEFEPVPAGVNVTHSFVVKNQGTAPLNIEKVRAG